MSNFSAAKLQKKMTTTRKTTVFFLFLHKKKTLKTQAFQESNLIK